MKKAQCKGFVKWFSPKKGYGFASTYEGQEYFLFIGSIADEDKNLLTDDSIEFDVEDSMKGPRAINVRRTFETDVQRLYRAE